jgi:hypothetical protein
LLRQESRHALELTLGQRLVEGQKQQPLDDAARLVRAEFLATRRRFDRDQALTLRSVESLLSQQRKDRLGLFGQERKDPEDVRDCRRTGAAEVAAQIAGQLPAALACAQLSVFVERSQAAV